MYRHSREARPSVNWVSQWGLWIKPVELWKNGRQSPLSGRHARQALRAQRKRQPDRGGAGFNSTRSSDGEEATPRGARSAVLGGIRPANSGKPATAVGACQRPWEKVAQERRSALQEQEEIYQPPRCPAAPYYPGIEGRRDAVRAPASEQRRPLPPFLDRLSSNDSERDAQASRQCGYKDS